MARRLPRPHDAGTGLVRLLGTARRRTAGDHVTGVLDHVQRRYKANNLTFDPSRDDAGVYFGQCPRHRDRKIRLDLDPADNLMYVHTGGCGCLPYETIRQLDLGEHAAPNVPKSIRTDLAKRRLGLRTALLNGGPPTGGDGYERMIHALEAAGLAGTRSDPDAVRGTGRYTCPACGARGDGHGLKVDRQPDGQPPKFWCHGCGAGTEILAAIGLTWADLGWTPPADRFATPPREQTDPQPSPPAEQATAQPTLTFLTIKELRDRVQAAGPRRWLLRGLWPGGDYGVHAGEMKAQKTWNTADLAIAVAAARPWLGHIPVEDSGPILMFVGEGGEANLLRRLDAIAGELPIDDLPITVCARAPHLSDRVHIGLMADQLDRVRPKLVTLDPLYLSVGGAKGSDLYAMGELLERPQHLCQEAGTALWVATHLNRKEGRGAARITGAGPAEWGRVLVTATVISRRKDRASQETTVITELDIIGGEVAGGTLRLTRRIRADQPADLDSPLHYHVETTEVDENDDDNGDAGEQMPPARRKLLAALRAMGGIGMPAKTLVDWIADEHGHGLRRETVSRELNELLRAGLADVVRDPGHESLWLLAPGV